MFDDIGLPGQKIIYIIIIYLFDKIEAPGKFVYYVFNVQGL